jgi:hypothetical protein
MKTPGDRIDTIEKNLGTLMIKALSLKLELSKADFKEEDHPRADDGKFGSGSGSHKESEKKEGEKEKTSNSSGLTEEGKKIYNNLYESQQLDNLKAQGKETPQGLARRKELYFERKEMTKSPEWSKAYEKYLNEHPPI